MAEFRALVETTNSGPTFAAVAGTAAQINRITPANGLPRILNTLPLPIRPRCQL